MGAEHMKPQCEAELDEVIRMGTNIEQLIKELCPDGVPRYLLAECASFKRGTALSRKNSLEGNIPVIAGGLKPAFYQSECNRTGETIVVAGSGANAGYLSYWAQDIFVSDAFSIDVDPGKLRVKFCFYVLQSLQNQIHGLKRGSGVPHVYPRDVQRIEIPIPPVEVQEEIVRILDLFTTLEAELEAELEKRVAQYAHYRSAFISQAYDKESVPLSDYVEFLNAKAHERLVADQGDIPLVTARFISRGGEANRFIPKSDVLTMAEKDDVLVVMSDLPNGKALARTFLVDKAEAYAVNQRVGILRVKDRSVLDPHFLSYVVERNPQLIRYDNGSDQTHLKKKYFLDMKIPAISVDEQRRIAGILDQMDALVNDLSSGLPAEITARRKQYEYYRDRLLSFPELTEPTATASPNTQEPTRP